MEFEEKIKVNTESFDKIGLSSMQEPFRQTIEKALKIIQNQAKSNLSSSKVNTSSEMLNGIVMEIANDSMHGRVRIRPSSTENYSTSAAKKTDYRLLFYDDGTRPRYINVKGSRKNRGSKMESMFGSGMKKGYRGKISATNFFTDAINSTKRRVEKIIDDDIEKEIEERFNKK